MPDRRKVLFVTDLAYQARGRRYCDEDIFLTSRLRDAFDIALCHPLDAAALMDGFDGVVVRNSGPVLHYQKEYDAFREQATTRGTRVYNPRPKRSWRRSGGSAAAPDADPGGYRVQSASPKVLAVNVDYRQTATGWTVGGSGGVVDPGACPTC